MPYVGRGAPHFRTVSVLPSRRIAGGFGLASASLPPSGRYVSVLAAISRRLESASCRIRSSASLALGLFWGSQNQREEDAAVAFLPTGSLWSAVSSLVAAASAAL